MTGAAALAFGHFRETRSAQHSVRFQVPPPEKSIISSFALSPDGRYLAFVAAEGGRTQLLGPSARFAGSASTAGNR